MPNRKDKTPGSDKIRERVVKAMKMIIAENPKVKTRVAFAERIKSDSSRISAWENSHGYPTLENIVDICNQFSISPDYLVLGKGEMFICDLPTSDFLKRLEAVEKKLKLKK